MGRGVMDGTPTYEQIDFLERRVADLEHDLNMIIDSGILQECPNCQKRGGVCIDSHEGFQQDCIPVSIDVYQCVICDEQWAD